MNNEELKKKIERIINDVHCPYPKDTPCKGCVEKLKAKERGYSSCQPILIADALIAAGIGDVKEAEHRAEVAEMAFLILWNECKGKVGWGVDCTMWYKKRAEKELAEERE